MEEIDDIRDTFREMMEKLCDMNDIGELMTSSFLGVLNGAMNQIESATIRRKEIEHRAEIARNYEMKIPF